ncbi:MAG: hypothetical protein H7A23_26195 [Leptospiraceae bacterium]|nr:hypothetical protein [Leptospiraceae bacterium]MCP5498062.1 hypothetical protein [Leptospiraceae bacterium]
MKNQSNPSNKEENSFQTESELMDQVVGLASHLISYFETLALYMERVTYIQIQKSIKYIDTLVIVLFIRVIGLVFLSGAVYLGTLKLYDGNHLYASLTVGLFFTIISVVTIRYLIKNLGK